ncbi:hypothetical protein MMC21_000247 [Puttea exsequens]|nr:hypothetical protein [Puttea exsequens]
MNGSTYSRVVVIPRLKHDNISWIAEEISDVDVVTYVADDDTASLHPPRNKGHEVMIYLSYIIANYHDLPDVVIFMHSHRWTHHNNALLGHDAVQMIRRLSNDHVAREGYFNMRCQWHPGCPEWLHPGNTKETLDKQEEMVLSRCWEELFPSEPLPRALGQPCCAQFALSKERIRSIPRSRFIFYRDWILRTPLSDYVSGRIWEYSWQYIFTGQSVVCPAEHICYCDGFGLCFEGAAEYEEFERLGRLRSTLEEELEDLRKQRQGFQNQAAAAKGTTLAELDPGRDYYLKSRIAALNSEARISREAALERGFEPLHRVESDQRVEEDMKAL